MDAKVVSHRPFAAHSPPACRVILQTQLLGKRFADGGELLPLRIECASLRPPNRKARKSWTTTQWRQIGATKAREQAADEACAVAAEECDGGACCWPKCHWRATSCNWRLGA